MHMPGFTANAALGGGMERQVYRFQSASIVSSVIPQQFMRAVRAPVALRPVSDTCDTFCCGVCTCCSNGNLQCCNSCGASCPKSVTGDVAVFA
jgi:hypothetical protein